MLIITFCSQTPTIRAYKNTTEHAGKLYLVKFYYFLSPNFETFVNEVEISSVYFCNVRKVCKKVGIVPYRIGKNKIINKLILE